MWPTSKTTLRRRSWSGRVHCEPGTWSLCAGSSVGWSIRATLRPTSSSRLRNCAASSLHPKEWNGKTFAILLREVELRCDLRAGASLSHLFLYTGCRVGDLVGLELDGLQLGRAKRHVSALARGTNSVGFRCPFPSVVRLQAYLETRPPVASDTRSSLGKGGR